MIWQNTESILAFEPLQGLWTDEQYLRLTDHGNQLIEFTDGTIEVLAMPTDKHQAMLEVLFLVLRTLIEQMGGKVRFAPLRLQIREGKYREPDLLLLCQAQDPRRQNRYWLGADLVVEIISPDNPERDTVVKRNDYAEAAIPEYWIVDPTSETITVLTLVGSSYQEYGLFARGTTVTSALLEGLALSVDAVFDAN
ncbi:Uma2 family endonuclease [Candidatus Chloroploca asiatica]|nr:Uma2 family endonuclease [Candidatus Chloroploca asiatica]